MSMGGGISPVYGGGNTFDQQFLYPFTILKYVLDVIR